MAGVTFTFDAAERIADTVHWAERERTTATPHGPPKAGAVKPIWAVITNASVDADGNVLGKIVVLDGEANVWEDRATNVKVKPLNGETLTLGQRYGVRSSGRTAAGAKLFTLTHSVGGTGGGGVTLREVDGVPSLAATVIEINQVDGGTVQDLGSGVGRVGWLSASLTQKGMVDTVNQSFAGTKTFKNLVNHGDGISASLGFVIGQQTATPGSGGVALGHVPSGNLILHTMTEGTVNYLHLQGPGSVSTNNFLRFTAGTAPSDGILTTFTGAPGFTYQGQTGTIRSGAQARSGFVVALGGQVGVTGGLL